MRGTVTRERIVTAAFVVLERDGLAGVTARAVAAELGVRASALYHHVPDMATLLDEMATALARELLTPGAEIGEDSLAQLLTAMGERIRHGLLSHRDGGRLYAGRRLRDIGPATAMEGPLARLTGAGLPLEQAVSALQALADLTVGFVIEEQHRSSAESGVYDAAARRDLVGPGFPLTAAASEAMFGDDDERFARELGFLVAGICCAVPSAPLGADTGSQPRRGAHSAAESAASTPS